MSHDMDPATASPAVEDAEIGVVVIGRNEGERLRRCLESLGELVRAAIYVDSGSDDGSIEMARGMGATVVELDVTRPFTAARARNAGFEALDAGARPVAFVQFVDGDCEVESGWLQQAAAELRANPELAVVFGRRRERAREATPYNRLCDLEWDVPIGDVESCGGDALMRAEAFRQCGGYDPLLIAGEEPELCHRLRGNGWGIRRIDGAMTVHDADMHRFGQWWRRAVRAGYVEAEGQARLGGDYARRRAAWSTLGWALLLPLAATVAIGALFAVGRPWLAASAAVAIVGLYALLWLRVWLRSMRRWPRRDAALYATFCLLGKWPMAAGMATYWWRRMRKSGPSLIEYREVS